MTPDSSIPASDIDDQFARKLLNIVDSLAAKDAPNDRNARSRQRRRLRLPCRIRHVDEQTETAVTVPGRTREISQTGLGVLARHRFRRGQIVRVDVTAPDEQIFHLTGQVVHVRLVKSGWFLVGIHLHARTQQTTPD